MSVSDCTPDFAALDAAGLNLHAVFDLADVPGDVLLPAGARDRFRQLILLGHGGRLLWEKVCAAGLAGEHPIDDHSVARAREWMAAQCPGAKYDVIYPGEAPLGLQSLGRLAGWHHEAPFRVGINEHWGPWFAYRVVLLADTRLVTTPCLGGASPCSACAGKPCVTACPAGAMAGGGFSLEKCIAYRQQPESRCALTCVAREACPVRTEHRYEAAQLAHSYARSLRMIAEWSRRGFATSTTETQRHGGSAE